MNGAGKKRIGGQAVIAALLVLFCAGELAGTLLYSGGATLSAAVSFFVSRTGCTFIQTLVNSFSGVFVLMMISFAAGLCPFMQPVIAAVPIFRGIGIGFMLAELYSGSGVAGIAAAAVMIVPYSTVSGIILAAQSKEALKMSVGIFRTLFPRGGCVYKIDIRLYAAKFAAMVCILACAAAADSLVTYFCSGLWSGIYGD